MQNNNKEVNLPKLEGYLNLPVEEITFKTPLANQDNFET